MKMFGRILVEFKADTNDPREMVTMFMSKYASQSPDPGWIYGETVDVTVLGVCSLCGLGILDGDKYQTQWDGEDDEMFCLSCWEKRMAELKKIAGGGE